MQSQLGEKTDVTVSCKHWTEKKKEQKSITRIDTFLNRKEKTKMKTDVEKKSEKETVNQSAVPSC